MDEICSAILGKLNDVCSVGNFIILEEDELYECFPEGSERKRDVLETALRKLKMSGYIELRYDRGDVFCLSPLKKPEKPQQEVVVAERAPDKKTYLLFAAACSLSSLVGGLIGGIAAAVIGGLIS